MKHKRDETLVNDPGEMRQARDASWLCKLFQELKMSVKDKQDAIRILTEDHKKSLLR